MSKRLCHRALLLWFLRVLLGLRLRLRLGLGLLLGLQEVVELLTYFDVSGFVGTDMATERGSWWFSAFVLVGLHFPLPLPGALGTGQVGPAGAKVTLQFGNKAALQLFLDIVCHCQGRMANCGRRWRGGGLFRNSHDCNRCGVWRGR